MSSVWVLDASAVLCYLQAEDGYAGAKRIITSDRAENTVLLSAVTWSEIIRHVIRRTSVGGFLQVRHQLDLLRLHVVDLTREGGERLARISARFRLSLGDAAVAAVAEERDGVILTCDPDFEAVEGRIPIEWIRRV